MTVRPRRPTRDTTLAQLIRDVEDLKRTPGQWIVVGTFPGDPGTVPESPPFLNGFANADPALGWPKVQFKIDKWRHVDIIGAPVGGALGAVIFQLPFEYRPGRSHRIKLEGQTLGTNATVQCDPTGDVIWVA
jgi:hypothetical protein